MRMDAVIARLEQAGSTLAHSSVLGEWVARHYQGLTEASDMLLRWRTGDIYEDKVDFWARTSGSQREAGLSPSRWPDGVLGVKREELGLLDNSQHHIPAVAYRLGSLTMIGVQERGNSVWRAFLRPVNSNGELDYKGEYFGVVMRTGPGFEGVIGTANESGRLFFPRPTTILASVASTPEGLKRV